MGVKGRAPTNSRVSRGMSHTSIDRTGLTIESTLRMGPCGTGGVRRAWAYFPDSASFAALRAARSALVTSLRTSVSFV